MERVLVVDAGRYSFKDTDSGNMVEGMNLTYFTGETETTNNRRGLVTLKITGDLSLWPMVEQVPGWYDLDVKMRPGAKGKPTLKLTGMQFLSRFDLSSAPTEASKSQVPGLQLHKTG